MTDITALARKADHPKYSLTVERLKEVLHYDPATGVFTRLITTSNRAKAGDVVSSPSGKYRAIVVGQFRYQAHHLAWLYMTGSFPKDRLDHIDTIKSNNTWNNLREATHAQNMQNIRVQKNNKVGLKGVSWAARDKRWRAQITFEGKAKYLGNFRTPTLAHEAYCAAAKELFKEFARFQ